MSRKSSFERHWQRSVLALSLGALTLVTACAASGELEAEEAQTTSDTLTADLGNLDPWGTTIDWSQLEPLETANSCPGQSSLRILTYNTQFLGWQVTHRSASLDKKRAKEMAKAVVRANADIVVLNEVFDEDAREQLRDTLKASGYPHFIYRIGGNKNLLETTLNPATLIATAGEIISNFFALKDVGEQLVDAVGPLKEYLHEDSGLMVFSRYPFAQFSVAPQVQCPSDVYAVSCNIECDSNNTYCQVGFTTFEHCSTGSWDCMADKGVGLVKVHIPCANRYVNLAFTHMQADDNYYTYAEYTPAEARATQMEQIHRDLEQALGDLTQLDEEVYVLGDMNIIGNAGAYEEWQHHFANSSSPFTTELRDSWYDQTVGSDVGQTSGGETFPHFLDANGDPDPFVGQRLDYILRTEVNNDYVGCLQHIHRAWKLREFDDPTINQSDHHGLLADFAPMAPHCNPKQAEQLPEPKQYAKTHGTDLVRQDTLPYQGSMHWYRLDKGGSFSIKVQPTGANAGNAEVAFEVYRPNDLGDPLNSYYGLANDWGTEFLLEEPPFYIRVFSPNRDVVGYRFSIHAHTGKSQQDAILTFPYAPQTEQLPTTTVGTSSNATWFKFVTFDALNGLPGEENKQPMYPQLTFLSKGRAFPMELIETDGRNMGTINVRSSRTVQRSEHAGYAHVIEADDIGQGVHYFRVLPTASAASGQQFGVEWRTTLTSFFPVSFACNDATDTLDEDEVFYDVRADGFRMWQDPHAKHLCDVDTGGTCDAKQIGVFKFIDNLRTQFAEDDTDYNNNDDWFPEWVVDLNRTSLPIAKAEKPDQHVFDNPAADGRYTLSYVMSHRCSTSSKSLGGHCDLGW